MSTNGAASPAAAASTSPLPGNAPSAADQQQQQPNQQPAATNPVAGSSGNFLPALPAPDGASGAGDEDGVRTVQVDGKPVALDKLGPMVVGRDGTVSRIANWQEMTEGERQTTLRVLCRRNQVRLANLRAGRPADAEEGQQEVARKEEEKQRQQQEQQQQEQQQ